jgi:glycosyltransferase involved in cell wall biosynthesis
LNEKYDEPEIPRRLLYVITGLGWGGAESQVIDLARAFNARAWAVEVISLLDDSHRKDDLERDGIRVQTLGMKRGLPDPRAIVRLSMLIRAFRPTIVHAHMVHANILTRLARLLAPIPVLITSAHNVNEGASWRMWAYRFTDRLTNLTTNVSSVAVERSVRRGAAPHGRIRCIPNGIDMTRFNAEPDVRQRVRTDLDVGNRFVWLCVASLEPQKDHVNLLHALALLKDHSSRPLILAVGEGSLRAELSSMAKSAAPNMIRFLGARSDVCALMAAADAFVLASAWEGLPLVLLEASASCLPIVCTDVGGNHEIVLDAKTGYLVPPGRPAELADAMATVMGLTQQQRGALAQRAREQVTENFGLERVVGRWEAIYAGLYEQGRGLSRRSGFLPNLPP